MSCSLDHSQVKATLDHLHTEAEQNQAARMAAPPNTGPRPRSEAEHFQAMRHVYMAVGRQLGTLLYVLAHGIQAKTVVEFGTSFGLSTIYLAAAVRDNGGGRVITTELIPEKAQQAQKNLTTAGLADQVEFRVGDALVTLRDSLPSQIDIVFLDSAKEFYVDVLKLLEPALRPGAIVAADNTNHDGIEPFLAYIRNPINGYTSSAIATTDRSRLGGHEIAIRQL